MVQVKKGDFIELSYVGSIKDGQVFDTTDEEVAKKYELQREGATFKPIVICVGQEHLLPALDKELEGNDVGSKHSLTLPPERAFGKREPSKLFKKEWFMKQKVTPMPGLEVTVGNDRGIIRSVSGGRVYVDLNHPLAGQEVTYSYEIISKVDDIKEQVAAIIKLRLGLDNAEVTITEDKAEVSMAFDMPEQLAGFVTEEIKKTTNIKEIAFKKKGDATQE